LFWLFLLFGSLLYALPHGCVQKNLRKNVHSQQMKKKFKNIVFNARVVKEMLEVLAR